jgi:hypothetical protein
MRRMVVSILLVVLLSMITLSAVGCHGLGETTAERSDDHIRQHTLNGSMMIDDVDAWLHLDRQSRLTEYTVR